MVDRRRMLLAGMVAAAAAMAPALAPTTAVAQTRKTAPDVTLARIIASPARPEADKARDIYRHPAASMAFFGLKPGMTVVDVDPGAGWWTDILAPYLAQTGGRYIATGADLADPAITDGMRKSRAKFEAKYTTNAALYGNVTMVGFGPSSPPLAPAGTVDLVLASRATHNWVKGDFITKAFADIYAALKHGGVMAIEDHRAPPGADPAKGNGYLPESYIIDKAKQAGFVLAGTSEINANPRDTKDYPSGVWMLPPVRFSGQPPISAETRAKYDAIGESDRMTLKFVKP